MIQSITTGKRYYPGDPDEPVLGTCRDCGADHYVDTDGMCVDDCGTCEIAFEDGDLLPCVLGRFQHAADMRRKSL